MRARYFKFLLERPKLFIFEITDVFMVIMAWMACVVLTNIFSVPDHFEILLTALFALVYLPYKKVTKPHFLFFKLTKRKSSNVTIQKGDI